jgi:hypothetical protein
MLDPLMADYDLDRGEIWLHADERVVQTIPIDEEHLGLITTRANGRYYASVLRLDRSGRSHDHDVPQWEQAGVDRVRCGSAAEARSIIGAFRANRQPAAAPRGPA